MAKWLRPLSAAVLMLLPVTAFAQGVIPGALQQNVNTNGIPLAGCLLYIFQAGTVATPQTAFSDSGLTTPLPNPLVCDQNGRIPAFYLASGSVHVRLTDASGIVQYDYPSLLVIGASSGSGGGGTVDPTTVASTGDVKYRPTGETLTGWVKLNGTTIGPPTSGAAQRANSDVQALFLYLWDNCSSPSTNRHCVVSGGLGTSAQADWNAGTKTITVPDMRGRTPVGLADMGSSAACGGRSDCLASSNVTSGGGDGAITPFATGGTTNKTITVANLPAYTPTGSVSTPSGTISTITPSGTVSVSQNANSDNGGLSVAGPGVAAPSPSAATITATFSGNAVTPTFSGNGATFSGSAQGGTSTAFGTITSFMLGTWFMKL